MSRFFHFAQSVDVDRFKDAYLRRNVCPFLTNNKGEHPSVAELRYRCEEARKAGLRVFPPCDNTKEDGSCAGHEEKPQGKRR